MSLIKELELIESRMKRAFELRRMDTFRQLMSERVLLLRRAPASPEKEQFLERALLQAEQWTERLGRGMGDVRTRQAYMRDQTAYRARSSHRINRSC
ncbi:MAG: hypothetical protein JXR25_04635 [Pontiellaceae bacterium]|nr:hypothetical protein [Pontiellaceae bacterium]MBN2784092.1 hypothetical protein [Pontiellaceae bacterium]